MRCARCDEPIDTASALYADRVVLDDGRLVCRECSQALRGNVRPVIERRDVPSTMPNTNPPFTH